MMTITAAVKKLEQEYKTATGPSGERDTSKILKDVNKADGGEKVFTYVRGMIFECDSDGREFRSVYRGSEPRK